MDVFDLMAKISLDSSEYTEGMADASSKSEGFASKIGSGFKTAVATAAAGITAAGVAVTALTKSFVNSTGELAAYGDEIDKNSQKMGVSAQFYQEWDAVLQHSGTSMSAMSGTFKTLAKAAQDSTDDQKAAFEQLGISMEEVANYSSEELFAKVISGLQGMEEGTERTYLAQQLLGRGAQEMGALLNTSAEDTQAMIDTVNDLGGVLSNDAVKAAAKYQDSLQDMKTAMTGLKNNAMANFLPAMSTVMDGLTKIFSGDSGGVKQIRNGIRAISMQIKQMLPSIKELFAEIIPMLADVVTDSLPIIIETAGVIIESLAKGIVDNLPSILDSALGIITMLGEGIVNNLDLLLNAALTIILTLADYLANNLPTMVPAIVDIILTIVDTLINNIDLLVDASIAIMIGLAEGLIQALPKLIEKAPVIVGKLVDAIVRNVPKLLTAALEMITTLGKGIVNNLPKIVENGRKIVEKLKEGTKQLLSTLVTAGAEFITNIINGIKGSFGSLKDAGRDIINQIWDGIKEKWEAVKQWFSDAAGSVKNFFKGATDSAASAVSGGASAIANNMGTVTANSYNANYMSTNNIETLLEEYLPKIGTGGVYLDSNKVVGQLAPAMNSALGKMSRQEVRYV